MKYIDPEDAGQPEPTKRQRPDPRQATAPLLAPWATDAQIDLAVKQLFNEINSHFGMIEYAKGREAREAEAIRAAVLRGAPALIRETEAFLQHETEGWLAMYDNIPKAPWERPEDYEPVCTVLAPCHECNYCRAYYYELHQEYLREVM